MENKKRKKNLGEDSKMGKFENVSVVKNANIYFDGKVTSRTVLFVDGTKKTLGIILPGEYEFSTGDSEVMELLAGKLEVLISGSSNWETVEAGQSFTVSANSKFKVVAKEAVDYCCSY
jgi:purine/pyrimidine-nucleoside phosphorylase